MSKPIYPLTRSEIVTLRNMWNGSTIHLARLIAGTAQGYSRPDQIRAALAEMNANLDKEEFYQRELDKLDAKMPPA